MKSAIEYLKKEIELTQLHLGRIDTTTGSNEARIQELITKTELFRLERTLSAIESIK